LGSVERWEGEAVDVEAIIRFIREFCLLFNYEKISSETIKLIYDFDVLLLHLVVMNDPIPDRGMALGTTDVEGTQVISSACRSAAAAA
jgi:hypothetical protein